MPQAAYILLGWLFTVAASFSLGRVVLGRFNLPLYREERWAYAFLLGSACLSMGVFALAAAQLLYKGVLLGAGIAAIVSGARVRSGACPALPALEARWKWFTALTVAPFVLLTFTTAMAPEMSADGSGYHLGLVAKYYRERGFSFLTTNMYANLSQGVEMLFLFAWPWGKHSAGALVHWTFLCTLGWLVVCHGRRFGHPVAGLAAGAMVFVTPVVSMDGSVAYNDVAAGAVLFGLFHLIRVWETRPHNRILVAAGMLAGFGYGIKYTAGAGLVYAVSMVAWRLRAGRRWALRGTVILTAAAAVFILPWMVKNAIIVSNPLSPFANRWFPNEYVHVSFEEDYRSHMRRYPGIESLAQVPIEAAIRGTKLCGLTGPLFLLAPLALLAWRSRPGRAALVAAAFFGAAYFSNIGTRFLIPALPLVAFALLLAVERWRLVVALLVTAHAIASWPDVLALYCDENAWRLERIWWRQALRIETEDGYLMRRHPGYLVARMIETLTRPGAKVLSWSQVSEAYTTREVIVAYQSAFGETIGKILWTPLIRELQPVRQFRFEIPGGPRIRWLRVRPGERSAKPFEVSELRLYRAGRERERDASWGIRSWPHPARVGDAFDNHPLTFWRSWDGSDPGQSIEVKLVRAEEVDLVGVESTTEAPWEKLRLEWEDEAGRRGEAGVAGEVDLGHPLGLRRAATALVKEMGIDYLLIDAENFGAEDYLANRGKWGIELIGERNSVRLYAIR